MEAYIIKLVKAGEGRRQERTRHFRGSEARC